MVERVGEKEGQASSRKNGNWQAGVQTAGKASHKAGPWLMERMCNREEAGAGRGVVFCWSQRTSESKN